MGAKSEQQRKRAGFPRQLSGNICLEFANTLDMRNSPRPIEYLTGYQDVVAWGQHVGLLQDAQAAQLLEQAARDPGAGAAVFNRSIELREALYRIVRSVAHHQAWQAEDMQLLKQHYLNALTHLSLRQAGAQYEWQPDEQATALDQMLWPVALAAIELMRSHMLARVKECPGAGDCGWLFLDTSKNGTRRWCSMESCGSRVKMRRQYARKQQRT